MKITKLLEKLGRWVGRHGKAVLTAAAVLAVLSALAITRLGVETDIAQMLPPDNPTAKSYTAITRDFDTTSTLIAVIQGENRRQLIRAAEELSYRIKEDTNTGPLVRSVQYKMDREFAAVWGLMMQTEE